MRTFILLIISSSLLFAELDVSGYAALDSQAYLTKPDAKRSSNFTASQRVDFKYEEESLSAYAKLYAQEDYDDTLSEDKQTSRTFARVDELYLKYDFENDSIKAGKNIKFWGALELRNIVDVFNPSDFRSDMLNSEKLGAWNASFSHFTQNGEISLTFKLHEQNQKMAESPYVYYFLPPYLEYDENLQTSDKANRPSLYLMYNGTLESEYAVDFAFIVENGYDSQRYINFTLTQPIRQYAYLVNKFMTYETMVINTTLLKLEALYADVIEDIPVGDYSHIALGVEHTIENIYESHSLGLIAEYYRYKTYSSGKYDDLKLFETMQNDLFLGVRYSFNNSDDSSIVAGTVRDSQYNEQTYFAKYESRFANSFIVELDYNYINPSIKEFTAYAALGKHQRVGLSLAYHF